MATAVTTYVDATEVKSHLGIEPSDTADDAVLTTKIVSACRAVDGVCRRRFWRDPVSPDPTSVRYFRPTSSCYAVIDDLIIDGDTVVALDGSDLGAWSTTVATTDYVVHPLNGIGLDGNPGWPAAALELVGTVAFSPWSNHLNLKITGRWGWLAVPAAVKEAALIVAADLYHYKDVRSGTLGFNEFGPVTVRTAIAGHAKSLLQPYRGPSGLLVA